MKKRGGEVQQEEGEQAERQEAMGAPQDAVQLGTGWNDGGSRIPPQRGVDRDPL